MQEIKSDLKLHLYTERISLFYRKICYKFYVWL